MFKLNHKCFVHLLLCVGLMFSAPALFSCQEDDNEPTENTVKKAMFDESSLSFEYTASSRTLYVNQSYYLYNYDIEASASWMSAIAYSGQQLRISIKENSTNSSRSGYIYLRKNGRLEFTISVTQKVNPNSSNQGDNQGGNNQGGNNQGGNNQGGGSSVTKPSAPSGVRVANEGSVLVPNVTVRWNEVSGATGYRVYRSTARDYGYSQIGTSQYAVYADNGRLTLGNTYYYKVTAVNSAGESEKSSAAEFVYVDQRKPGAPQYGSCTASGGQMTIRWSIPSGSQDGKPTKHILRVRHPQSGQYTDLQTLSGTATSVSFAYGMWLDSDRRIYVGIIAENDYGSATKGAIVYEENTKKWYIP